jgi:FkbM family methyltransferase
MRAFRGKRDNRGMSPSAIPSALLPYGVASRIRNRQMLSRLGAATTKPRVAGLAREARLDLLPPGALSGLETVIDVGANQGRWSSALLAVARPQRLIAVEPSPDVLPLLREAIGASPQVSIVAAAVGASVGDVELIITNHPHLTSLLPPRSEAMNAAYGGDQYDVNRRVTVPLTTIDEVARDSGPVSLLKLDVQGGELAALEGAHETLARTRWLLIEANFQSHYVGDAVFPELHEALTGLGFLLTGMSPPFVNNGVALWADCLYARH